MTSLESSVPFFASLARKTNGKASHARRWSRFTFAVQDGNVIGGQSSLGLDADEQRAAAAGGDAFAREVHALEAKRKGAFL